MQDELDWSSLLWDTSDFSSFLSSYNSDQNLMELASLLESLVGKCYCNKQKRGEFYYRYPVVFTRDGIDYECKGRIPDLQLEEIDTVRYITGANELHIGAALLKVLKYLEYRYLGDLDFKALERKYQSGYYEKIHNYVEKDDEEE